MNGSGGIGHAMNILYVLEVGAVMAFLFIVPFLIGFAAGKRTNAARKSPSRSARPMRLWPQNDRPRVSA